MGQNAYVGRFAPQSWVFYPMVGSCFPFPYGMILVGSFSRFEQGSFYTMVGSCFPFPYGMFLVGSFSRFEKRSFYPMVGSCFPFPMGCFWLETSAVLNRDHVIQCSEAVFPFLMDVSGLKLQPFCCSKIVYFPLDYKKFQFAILRFHLSLVMRKPVFGVSDQVQHKPGCTATEDA